MLPLIIMLVMTTVWTPERAIKEYVQKHYPWPSVEVTDVVSEEKLPSYPPEQIVVKRGPVGRAEFLFVYKKGMIVKVRARVEAKDWVLKTARPLMKGATPHRGDLYLSLLDINRIPRGAIKDWQELDGKILKRSLQANSVITTTVLKNKPIIKRGDKVLLIYRGSGLKVTALGLARESGALGDDIAVVNLASKRYIRGVIEDEGVVSVSR
ncbi:MAG: flagellar basal body P-ring formation protein FlgA [Nitrospirae bacterium]|nr:flagellar basal body P-ring formation protein FlgA [Nitrospirota bacterium]